MGPLAKDVDQMACLKHVQEKRQVNHQPMYVGDKAVHHQALPCDLPQKVALQSVTRSQTLAAHGDVLKRNRRITPAGTPHQEKEIRVGKCVGIVEVPEHSKGITPTQAPRRETEATVGKRTGVVAPTHSTGITPTQAPCWEKDVQVGKRTDIVEEVPMHSKGITPSRTPGQEKEVQVGKNNMDDKEEMTSLVVRNLPESCTQEDLMLEWPNHDGAVDLLYMPRKTKDQAQNIAFINFTSNAAARAFRKRWHGQLLSPGAGNTSTRLNVGFAKVQGQAAILSLLKKRRVGRVQPQYQPILFQKGVRMSLGNTLAATDKQKTAESQNGSLASKALQSDTLAATDKQKAAESPRCNRVNVPKFGVVYNLAAPGKQNPHRGLATKALQFHNLSATTKQKAAEPSHCSSAVKPLQFGLVYSL